MSAAQITPKVFPKVGILPIQGRLTKVTQNDWSVFGGVKGLIGMNAHNYTGAVETFTYGTAAINNSGTAYTATDTSIVIGTAPATRSSQYYILTTSGEILHVSYDSAPTTSAGTLTVQRGCLGTTASATGLAHTNTVYILNIIYWSSANTGITEFQFNQLPNDPGVKLFYTDSS